MVREAGEERGGGRGDSSKALRADGCEQLFALEKSFNDFNGAFALALASPSLFSILITKSNIR
jgi:hypothetical protein